MKVLLFALVLALAGGAAYYFYFKDHPLAWTQGPELASSKTPGTLQGGQKDFKDLNARLQGAMDQIPVSLREPRRMPAVALDTRSKIAPYVQLHTEYVTLIQVCDLIIEADQAFADHQERCGLAPVPATANAQERARAASAANPASYQQRQTIWDGQRRQADSKVRQLLVSLENRRL